MLRPIEIETKLLEPDAFFSTAAQPFRGQRKDGSAVTGILLNQDTFSYQILDATGTPRSIQKDSLTASSIATKSNMPSYKDKLNAQELADLIAYLSSMRGAQ